MGLLNFMISGVKHLNLIEGTLRRGWGGGKMQGIQLYHIKFYFSLRYKILGTDREKINVTEKPDI